MQRALAAGIAALLILVGAAVAAAATAPTVVTFTHWRVTVIRNGKSVSHRVPVGGTFARCASRRLYEITVYYTTTGPNTGEDIEKWYLNGTLRDTFYDKPPNSKLGPSGTFAIYPKSNTGSIPSGTWKLIIRYGGQPVGQASVAVTVNSSC